MTRYLVLIALLAGCASTGDKEFYQAQMDLHKQVAAEQKPLVRLTAQPGQTITGLQSLEVNAPTPMPALQNRAPNEWASVVSQGLGVFGTVLGIRYATQGAVGLATSVGNSNAAIASQIQAPGATTTNTLSGTGVLGTGAYTTTANPITTTTTTTDNHSATAPPTVVNPIVVTSPPGMICTMNPVTFVVTCQ